MKNKIPDSILLIYLPNHCKLILTKKRPASLKADRSGFKFFNF